jgi:hypothetical protein
VTAIANTVCSEDFTSGDRNACSEVASTTTSVSFVKFAHSLITVFKPSHYLAKTFT